MSAFVQHPFWHALARSCHPPCDTLAVEANGGCQMNWITDTALPLLDVCFVLL